MLPHSSSPPFRAAGEATHWSPFQAAAATYVRQNGGVSNASMANLVAFFVGITSHYIADLSWHGMIQTPVGYGLIETVGGTDYQCSGGIGASCMSPAHSISDTGGEFVAAFSLDLSWFAPSWDLTSVPIDDLMPIYSALNITGFGPADIKECQEIFFIGSEAIASLAELVEPLEVAAAPTLGERYQDLPLGGLDDMAM